jgi:PAS domain S-box-containing protein
MGQNDTLVNVLLVDDDEDDYIITRDLFDEIEGGAFHLEWINSYSAALTALKANRYDVCLVDFRLGENTGLELLREAGGVGSSAPIILLTGQGDRKIDVEAMRAGAADYLIKGQIDSALLDRSIRYAVERKRTEAELKAYREQLETLVQERTSDLERAMAEVVTGRDRIDAILRSVADGLIVTDLNQKVILANPAAEALLGFRLSEVIGQEISMGIRNNKLREIIRNTSEQHPQGYEIDVELKEADNRPSRVLRARTAVVDDRWEQPLGTVTIIQDVTRLREIDRLKTELLTTAAHELRTPLTSILGFSEILLTRSLDQTRHRSYLQLIHEQSSHLSEIIQDLLDVSRLEAGRGLELKLQPIDLTEMVKQVIGPYLETETNHQFLLEGLKPLPQIRGDGFRLTQVCRNLLSNALKYSPQGSEITIESRLLPESVEIRVQDQGIGMTPEQQKPLFEPFYRADNSHTAVGGTGLGLAVSKMIIEQHGGKIWLESERGVGTIACFMLPLQKTILDLS